MYNDFTKIYNNIFLIITQNKHNNMKVKSIASAAQKFVTRASAATGDYKEGVNNTNDQSEKAIAAEEAYVAGITESIARGARVAGLQKAGNAKWKERTLVLGAGRFATGIKAGEAEYKKNTEPYFAKLNSLTLSPRGPKGSPENYQRASEVGQALHQHKIESQTI